MVRHLGDTYGVLKVATLIVCCFQESSSFNLHNNRLTHCHSTVTNINQNPSTELSNPIRQQRLLATSSGVGNNFEEALQHSQNHASSLNAAAGGATWDDVLIPSLELPVNDHTKITAMDKLGIAIFGGCSIGVFLSIVLKSAGSWRFFLAGGLCAAISHTIPTPVDVIKTRKQVDTRFVDKSFVEAGRVILKEDGFSALWAGLGPTTFGYLLEGAVKFGVYEVLKPAIKSWLSVIASMSSFSFLNSHFFSFVLSGIASGLAASFILCPMEVIRIRLVAEPNYTSGNWIRGGYKILKKEGVQGFSKGLNPMILKQVPYTVTKNVSFDVFTKFFYSCLRNSGVATVSHAMKFTIPLVSAAIASVLSSLTSQPGDTILSLSCAHGGDYRTRDISRNILRSDRGIAGFFVGTRTRLLHVGMIVTIQLLIYDYVKRICGIGATGLA